MKYIIFTMLLIMITTGYYTADEQHPQQAYIQLTKKRCLGMCPVYDLFIYINGVVVYNGIDHVTDKGKRQFELSEEKLNEVKALLDDLDIESLKKHTYKKTRDLPVTELFIDGTKLSFQGRDIPEEVQTVITALEALI